MVKKQPMRWNRHTVQNFLDVRIAPDVVMACCGDVPTLETLAAVSILREHLPDLKIRVVNVVDRKRLTKPSFRRPVDVMNCGHE
jgi:phosphoketolase